jgi:hypothetical protein
MEIQGYVIEIYTKYDDTTLQDDPPIYWEKFSSKIYKTPEVAIKAWNDSPYRTWDGHWVKIARIIPIYREDNENNFYYL